MIGIKTGHSLELLKSNRLYQYYLLIGDKMTILKYKFKFHRSNLILITMLSLMLGLSLTATSQEIEEVVVSGSFIPDEKRDTSEISSILDSSEIERTGDDNIAVALTRLTGLSLVRGKYVYVRGIEHSSR